MNDILIKLIKWLRFNDIGIGIKRLRFSHMKEGRPAAAAMRPGLCGGEGREKEKMAGGAGFSERLLWWRGLCRRVSETCGEKKI